MRRYLPGRGWVGVGFSPTFSTPAGHAPTTPAMVAAPAASKTYSGGTAPTGLPFTSFPSGTVAAPRAGIPAKRIASSTPSSGGSGVLIPGLRAPSVTSPITPTSDAGSGDSGGDTSTPDMPDSSSAPSAPDAGGGTIVAPAYAVAQHPALEVLDRVTRSWTVAAALVGLGALSWFFGARLRGAGLAAFGGWVGYRASRS